MPSTYTPIATTTLGSATNSVTFSSIPSTYTDLVLITNTQRDTSGSGPVGFSAQFNSDTGSSYSQTAVVGDGSSAYSGRDSNITAALIALAPDSQWGNSIVNVMNYANTTTYKTVLTRINTITNYTGAFVALWRNTAAINTITISGTVNIKAGSTFTLYGVKSA